MLIYYHNFANFTLVYLLYTICNMSLKTNGKGCILVLNILTRCESGTGCFGFGFVLFVSGSNQKIMV